MIDQKYFDKVKKHFGSDMEKTWKYLKSSHAELGISLIEALSVRRNKKVEEIIDKLCEHDS